MLIDFDSYQKIEIPVKPVPWSAPQKSGNRFYSTHGEIQKQIKFFLRSQYQENLLLGPIRACCFFQFLPPKSLSKKKYVELMEDGFHLVKPDVSNLEKFLIDCGNGIIWHDDRQVVSLYVEKSYGEEEKCILFFKEAL